MVAERERRNAAADRAGLAILATGAEPGVPGAVLIAALAPPLIAPVLFVRVLFAAVPFAAVPFVVPFAEGAPRRCAPVRVGGRAVGHAVLAWDVAFDWTAERAWPTPKST